MRGTDASHSNPSSGIEFGHFLMGYSQRNSFQIVMPLVFQTVRISVFAMNVIRIDTSSESEPLGGCTRRSLRLRDEWPEKNTTTQVSSEQEVNSSSPLEATGKFRSSAYEPS